MNAQAGPDDRADHCVRQADDRGANHEQGTGTPPEYVVEAWISKQLRDRIQHNKASRAEPLQAANTYVTHVQTGAPQPDLEAEP
jgi:hypothetical protein